MTREQKVNLIHKVMDELAAMAYLESPKDKAQAVELIKDQLKGFEVPTEPSQADRCIYNASVFAELGNRENPKLLQAILKELETALTLLLD